HVLEPVAALTLAGIQREIPILMQPRVQVDAAGKRLEAVIGDREQQGLVVDLVHDSANKVVHAAIEIFDHTWPLVAGNLSRRRMVIFQIAPEHVLYAISRVENTDTEALRSFVQSIEEHALAILMVGVTLREEGLVVEDLFVERPGVFCQTKSGVGTEKFLQID